MNSISSNGKNMSLNTKDNLHLVSEELHRGQLKACLGFQQTGKQNNHMMNQCQKESIKIISVLLGFTVLKQYVHHCGVVVTWAKFPKAESPTNILAFLENVFQTEESRPDYICIDKGCLVLRTALRNGSWNRIWEKTT